MKTHNRLGLAGLVLVASMPFNASGQGTAEHLGAMGLRDAAIKSARKGDTYKAQSQMNAARTLDMLGTGGDNDYLTKTRNQADIDAAKIRADAERDAARILADANNRQQNNSNDNQANNTEHRYVTLKPGYVFAPDENEPGKYKIVEEQPASRPEKTYEAFACSDLKCDEKGQTIGYVEKGKREFYKSQNEQAVLTMNAIYHKGEVVVYKLFKNEDKEPLSVNSKVVESDYWNCGLKLKDLEVAKYKCEWYVNGDINPVRRVEIEFKP